jgi:hypothetical protein
MVNFYPRFLPNCALVLRPLTDLLRGGWAKNVGVHRQGTGGIPKCIAPPCCSGTTPAPLPNAELSLATDTSNTHIGGVKQQKSGDHW